MTRRIDLPPAETPNEGQRGTRTRLVGPDGQRPASAMDDPVVGWLVIVNGTGQGSALELGYGENPLGRGSAMRISLDFGAASDAAITAERHAVVTYYSRERLFRIRHELGRNPTYLNDKALLEPTELKAGDIVEVGKTRLRFVPLCGPDFEWTDTAS